MPSKQITNTSQKDNWKEGGGLKKGLSLNQNDYDSIEGVTVDLELEWQELRKSTSNSNY